MRTKGAGYVYNHNSDNGKDNSVDKNGGGECGGEKERVFQPNALLIYVRPRESGQMSERQVFDILCAQLEADALLRSESVQIWKSNGQSHSRVLRGRKDCRPSAPKSSSSFEEKGELSHDHRRSLVNTEKHTEKGIPPTRVTWRCSPDTATRATT